MGDVLLEDAQMTVLHETLKLHGLEGDVAALRELMLACMAHGIAALIGVSSVHHALDRIAQARKAPTADETRH